MYMKNKKNWRVTTNIKKSNTKEKLIGILGWTIAILLIIYLIK